MCCATLTWTIKIEAVAARNIKSLDRPIQKRIAAFLRDRLAPLDNPRAIGEALHGADLGEFWKYRVGDYRLIARIDDQVITITLIRIAHRREAYR